MAKKTGTSTETEIKEKQEEIRTQIYALLDGPSPDPLRYRQLAALDIECEMQLCRLTNAQNKYKTARDVSTIRGEVASLISWTPDSAESTATDWGELLDTPQPVVHKVNKTKSATTHQGIAPALIHRLVNDLNNGITMTATAAACGINLATVRRYKEKHIRDGLPLPPLDPLA